MRNKKGFTLIELLVVIAIIALLLAILMPALSMVKKKAATAVCLTNTKNLALGWHMYQTENDGKIMSSDMGRDESWIQAPYNMNNTPSVSCTGPETVDDEAEIRGIKDGVLYQYLEDPDVYHCLGDRVRTSFNGDGGKVFVSYAIPACLNGRNPGGTGAYRENQIHSASKISIPSSRYIFVETAEERNWTMGGHFVFGFPKLAEENGLGHKAVWWGPMAVNHGDASILGFADGHSEMHKWRV